MQRTRRTYALILVSLGLGLGACSAKRDDGNGAAAAASAPPVESAQPETPESDAADAESAHHVVFADRTTHAYLLLLPGDPGPAPTREELSARVQSALPGADDEPEVRLLLELVTTEPKPPQSDPRLSAQEREAIRHSDLLGLHIAVMPISPAGQESLISEEVLLDPISTRTLSGPERASLATRHHVLLLRGHYRNRYGVRGLRLLQTLVRIVAAERGALIHDPDTGETMGLEAFTQRRLQSSVGNVAEQVVVVPFADPRHGETAVRLTTRGMRRFGSVDLELDGLPRDPAVLEAATHLINGLAYVMVRMGEYDRQGYAVEVDDTVAVDHAAVAQAYAGSKLRVPRCDGCPQEIELHLVERPAEAQDPIDHVVARIVAPRPVSDDAGYDHPGWVRRAVTDLLGVQ